MCYVNVDLLSSSSACLPFSVDMCLQKLQRTEGVSVKSQVKVTASLAAIRFGLTHTHVVKSQSAVSAWLTFHSVSNKKILRWDCADELNSPGVFQTQQKTKAPEIPAGLASFIDTSAHL